MTDEKQNAPVDHVHDDGHEPELLNDADGDAAQAFDALRNQVEKQGQLFSTEMEMLHKDLGLAYEQFQDMVMSLDPSPEISKIVQRLTVAGERLQAVEQSPLLRQGPEYYARALERTGDNLVRSAAEQLQRQTTEIERIGRNLASHTKSAYDRHSQDMRVLLAAGIGLVVGLALMLFAPRILPDSIGMAVASSVMNTDRWNAGANLMQAGDPKTWNELVDGHSVFRVNKDILAECRAAAAKTGKEQKCTVIMPVGDDSIKARQ